MIWYALHWDFDFAGKMLVHFIRHISASEEDALLQDLENDDKRYEISQRYTNEPAFRQQFHQQLQQYLLATFHMKDVGILQYF